MFGVSTAIPVYMKFRKFQTSQVTYGKDIFLLNWCQRKYVKRFKNVLFVSKQQFGKILDVEIIFNERGSKVHGVSVLSKYVSKFFLLLFFFTFVVTVLDSSAHRFTYKEHSWFCLFVFHGPVCVPVIQRWNWYCSFCCTLDNTGNTKQRVFKVSLFSIIQHNWLIVANSSLHPQNTLGLSQHSSHALHEFEICKLNSSGHSNISLQFGQERSCWHQLS